MSAGSSAMMSWETREAWPFLQNDLTAFFESLSTPFNTAFSVYEEKKSMKIINRIKNIKNAFSFEFGAGVLEIVASVVTTGSRIGKRIHKIKHDRIIRILKRRYAQYISELNDTPKSTTSDERINKNIFIMWYQGIENAPLVCRKCIESIAQNYPDYHLEFIDKSNIKEITNLPEYIFDKVERGYISLTHLSDLVRMAVLMQYGGVWIDSTCFATGRVDFGSLNLFTIKHGLYSTWHVCEGKWAGFFLASCKGDYAITWFYYFFMNYWKKNNILPCYFFIDCVMRIAYETNPIIQKEIDQIPINNTHVFELNQKMEEPYSEEELAKMNTDTCVYKLTYKEDYIKKEGTDQTFFERFILKN